MSRVIHVFRRPERFVAGTVGEPGDRSFYLQAVEQARTISVLLEKQQVSVLAERMAALLEEVARRFGGDTPEGSPGNDLDPLAVPLEEEFRVGTMGLGWDADSRSIVVDRPGGGGGEGEGWGVLDDPEGGPDALRVFLPPVQAREFAARAGRVAPAGRPPCPLCAEPLDP